ncbi:hypothetical protein NDU88_005811 [Pleurodeles waltl]|uniref:Uncharacterized protein n=1 Tax=Pleurodeles waltl TaxID=8319 RepID=A0AAV7SMS6_PLEWA|nr:hypothetical protein NDU88_005811 [Pleurodeles waltl]
MDLIKTEALVPERPARQASAGVAAAVLACSAPRAALSGFQVRRGARAAGGLGGEERPGRVRGKPGGGRLRPGLWGSPRGRGALLASLVPRARPAMEYRELLARRPFPWGRGPRLARRGREVGAGVCAACCLYGLRRRPIARRTVLGIVRFWGSGSGRRGVAPDA